MIKEYTKEDLIELVEDYFSINYDLTIEFYVVDGVYTLEFSLPSDYLDGHHMEYECIAKIFEEFNEKDEELETILEVCGKGMILEEFPDGWLERIVI